MDHMRILRRAFEILRSYRVLWIFGFLLALTSSNGGGSNSGYNFSNRDFQGSEGQNFPWPPGFHRPDISPDVFNGILGAGIALLCLLVLLGVAFTIVRYVSETSAIRMVDRYEAGGVKVRFREGWRMGWSRAAFRMWLADLVFGLGVTVAFIVLLAIAAAPLLVWLTQNDVARAVGTVAAIGLGVLWLLLIILSGAALSLLFKFIHRAIALEDLGVFDAIRRGWAVARRRLSDVIIMGLILFGIGLVLTIVMIPVGLLLLAVAAVSGGLPALLAGGLTNIFVHGSTPQIVALAVGIPVFLAVLALPLTFLGGLLEAFSSSAWTLVYREAVALETVQPQVLES